jgi:hypothetical protein
MRSSAYKSFRHSITAADKNGAPRLSSYASSLNDGAEAQFIGHLHAPAVRRRRLQSWRHDTDIRHPLEQGTGLPGLLVAD